MHGFIAWVCSSKNKFKTIIKYTSLNACMHIIIQPCMLILHNFIYNFKMYICLMLHTIQTCTYVHAQNKENYNIKKIYGRRGEVVKYAG